MVGRQPEPQATIDGLECDRLCGHPTDACRHLSRRSPIRDGFGRRPPDRIPRWLRDPLVVFVLLGIGVFALDAWPPTQAEVEEYYALHAGRYRSPGRTTFDHVFLSGDSRTDPAGEAAALLGELRVDDDGWQRLGDRGVLPSIPWRPST